MTADCGRSMMPSAIQLPACVSSLGICRLIFVWHKHMRSQTMCRFRYCTLQRRICIFVDHLYQERGHDSPCHGPIIALTSSTFLYPRPHDVHVLMFMFPLVRLGLLPRRCHPRHSQRRVSQSKWYFVFTSNLSLCSDSHIQRPEER